MTTRAFKILAWLGLAAIITVTVSPIGLRPHDLLPVDVDRALAFVVATMFFVMAYPRQWVWIALAMVIGAGGIELLQNLSPTRHPEMHDAMVKAAGASVGAVLGWAFNTVVARFSISRIGQSL